MELDLHLWRTLVKALEGQVNMRLRVGYGLVKQRHFNAAAQPVMNFMDAVAKQIHPTQ